MFFMMWTSGGSASKKLSFRIAYLDKTAGSIFYQAGVQVNVVSSASDLDVPQGDIGAAATKGIYIGGYPAVSAQLANSDYGGCGIIRDVSFMPNYTPTQTASASLLILNHMFERGTKASNNIFKYFFRIKNVNALNLVQECNVPDLIQLKMKDTNNGFIKKGIQFGYGDYYECVNSNMVQTGDLVVSFKFYVSQLPSTEINLISLVYKSPSNFYSNAVPNGKLPVWFNLIKLGAFLGNDGKIRVFHMGLSFKLSHTYAVDTGYTVTLVIKKVLDGFGTGALEIDRLFIVFVNEVKSEEFIMQGDFSAMNDVSDLLDIKQNHHFYLGDFTSHSIDRYNYAFVTPNPLNSFGPSNSERTFSSTFLNMQDIVIFEHATATTEAGLLGMNCKIGIAGQGFCLLCASGYALDSNFNCQLMTALPTYIVFSNNYDLMIECGVGLFFNTVLQICQNCPSDCAVCNSITDCVMKKLGCTTANCIRCDKSNVCHQCDSGYVLDTTANQCLKCQISSGTNPCYSCLKTNLFDCLTCFEGYYFNTGTSSCEACETVSSRNPALQDLPAQSPGRLAVFELLLRQVPRRQQLPAASGQHISLEDLPDYEEVLPDLHKVHLLGYQPLHCVLPRIHKSLHHRCRQNKSRHTLLRFEMPRHPLRDHAVQIGRRHLLSPL